MSRGDWLNCDLFSMSSTVDWWACFDYYYFLVIRIEIFTKMRSRNWNAINELSQKICFKNHLSFSNNSMLILFQFHGNGKIIHHFCQTDCEKFFMNRKYFTHSHKISFSQSIPLLEVIFFCFLFKNNPAKYFVIHGITGGQATFAPGNSVLVITIIYQNYLIFRTIWAGKLCLIIIYCLFITKRAGQFLTSVSIFRIECL